MCQDIHCICSFFIIQVMWVANNHFQRNMQNNIQFQERLRLQYFTYQTVHKVLAVVFGYPFLTFKKLFFLFGITLVQVVKNRVYFTLNDFKVVILNIVNQFPYVSVLLVLVSVSYNNQLINSASNCYVQTVRAILEISYLVIDSAKNNCVLFLPLELINCCCFYCCPFESLLQRFRMIAVGGNDTD